jgi:hypothetical protein
MVPLDKSPAEIGPRIIASSTPPEVSALSPAKPSVPFVIDSTDSEALDDLLV